ncbi:heavy-metal-associated domain-containing protein [Kocuria aegyptia]|uniref:Heavy-metal-associated domain-containing protein n=1 Tax=Kocuria aegyptia TaxID=330943 RepID=A0ABP4WLH2_9MICC
MHAPVPSRSAAEHTVRATYQVVGMSCGHCRAAVIEEVGALTGVGAVDVELSTGHVTVLSNRPLTRSAVAAALEEAGCTLL